MAAELNYRTPGDRMSVHSQREYSYTQPSSSIIKENMIALPISHTDSHNLNSDFPVKEDQCYLGHMELTYDEIVDSNNIDHSVIVASSDEADSSSTCSESSEDEYTCSDVSTLPRQIQPRQFDNLVEFVYGNVHIVLDAACGITFQGICYATPSLLDECLHDTGLLVPVDQIQSEYVLAQCEMQTSRNNFPPGTLLHVGIHGTPFVTASVHNQQQTNSSEPTHTKHDKHKKANMLVVTTHTVYLHESGLMQQVFQVEEMKQSLVQIVPDGAKPTANKGSDLLELANCGEKQIYTPHCPTVTVFSERNSDSTCTSTQSTTTEASSDHTTISRRNKRKELDPRNSNKTKRQTRRDSGDERRKKFEIRQVKKNKTKKTRHTSPSRQRVAEEPDHGIAKSFNEGAGKEKHLPVPQEEVQYGTRSSMAFSQAHSWMNILEAFTQYDKKPVICLLKKDLVCNDFFSPNRRSRLRTMGSEAAAVDVSSSSQNFHGETRDIDRSAIRIQPVPHPKITPLLHASEYSQIIQVLGDIDKLPREEQVPAYFVAGVAYFKMSKFVKSKEHFMMCETLATDEHRDGDIMLCNAYMGDIEYASQSYLKAAEYYERSVKHYSPGSVALLFKLTPPTLSAVHAKKASAYRNSGKMIEAVKDYKTAINTAQIDRDRLSAHTSLGNLNQSMGDNSNALAEYKESIKLAEKLSDYVSLGWAHGNIGNAYLGLNRKDEAIHHLKKSLDLAVDYERTPQAIGRTYNNLGTAYQSMNDLDKAEEYYDLALSQAVYGNDIAGQARVYGNIGNVYMLRKNYERATPHYSEVLRLSSDPATISTARHNRGCAYYEWATSIGVKALQPSFHGPECNSDSCLKNLSFKARQYFSKGSIDLEEVVKYHEKRLSEIKGSKNGLTLSVSLIESNSRTFHRLQDCLVNLHRWEEALVVAEKSRARTLGELMLKRSNNFLEHSMTAPLTFEEIKNIVQSQKCPVVYLSYTGARLIGWVFITRSGKVLMNMFEVPLTDDQFDGKSFDYHLRYSLTEKLVEHSFEMYQPITYNRKSGSTVQVLYDLVAMPVTKFLTQHGQSTADQKVICISDSYTCLLPLTCLFDRDMKTFFGDHFYFKLSPSLLSLGIMSQLPDVTVTLQVDQRDFCVIGDPNIPPFYLNGEQWSLGKLPYARKEAEWVAHALHTTPILNEHASKTALLNRAMSAKIIHIATHGSASSGFLAFSTFSTAAKSGSYVNVLAENVLLYPEDVEKLHISPALVVLSSCDSGRGTVKADGIQGMARAFILAGAQSVLTTLWKVPDESASVFMQFFYQYLLDEMESSYALHKAILSVRCFAKYSHYIHWSGYQLTGRDILFCKKKSTTEDMLTKRLGTASVFPRLQEFKALEKVFIKSPSLPTDVQVLRGCPGMKSSEVVVDFISSCHQSFSAGVFWINCSELNLMNASISCIEKILGCDVQKLPISASQQALFVFDGMSHLPDSEGLLRTLKNKNVHIIIVHESFVRTDKLMKEVDQKLIRGCNFVDIKPLTMIHSTQRIVHSFMKEYEFTPMNHHQFVFEKLAEFTSGSPSLVDIASKVVCSSFEQNEEPIEVLSDILALKIQPQAKEMYSTESLTPYQAVTRTISSNMDEFIQREAVGRPLQDNSRDIWSTNASYDSWDSVMTLINSCNLSAEERLLLNSLSIFNCTPIPYSLVTELALVIANSSQVPHLAGTLDRKLFNYKLICEYPHPIVVHDVIFRDSIQENLKLVYVPLHVSQCMWKTSEKVDQVVILSLVYYAISRFYQAISTENHFGLCLFHALCSMLLHTSDSNFKLLGKDCYQEIYGLFLHSTSQ